jgi:molecular chaperone DnaK
LKARFFRDSLLEKALTDNVQKLLGELAKLVAERLAVWLPAVGGDTWWKFYVFLQLSLPQQKLLSEIEGSIADLDAAAVFRVLSRNWKELSNHQMTGLRATGFKYAKEALDIRNELAHMRVGGSIETQDALRHLDTMRRLAESLKAPENLIGSIEAVYREVLLGAVSKSNEGETQSHGQGQPEINFDSSNSQSPEQKEQSPSACPNTPVNSLVSLPPDSVAKCLETSVYIGIDFGTSTTVVSAVQLNQTTGLTDLRPLAIAQPTQYGDSVEHYLVNSVLTQHKGKLLFGTEAARLKVKHIEGEDVFSSFKMMLGLNLPNRYPNSKVKSSLTGEIIHTPQAAATEFFSLLRAATEAAVKSQLNTFAIKYAISVPASFEANQRQDLLACLNSAGFPIESSSLIDEPNAAFLSYLHDSWQSSSDFCARAEKSGPKRVLVFDFGAGTCDISVLQLTIKGQLVSSRNLSISRFMALGGDDIDRVIAKKYLLSKVVYTDATFSPTQKELDERIIPWLKPAAEELKITCTDELNQRQEDRFEAARGIDFEAVGEEHDLLRLGAVEARLPHPSLLMSDYVDILKAFATSTEFDERDADGEAIVGEPKSIIAPINNAIGKAGLDIDDIDAVLFIGGSAKNPLVRRAVMDVFASKTEALIPSNLQAHVSKGAALHCLGHYALGVDFVQPITSEPIFLITRGASLKIIMPAGSPVPSPAPFTEIVRVGRSGQRRIELPICVSNENKLLGMLSIESPDSKGFSNDESITLSCSLTHDKLFEAVATIRGITRRATLTNPLSNRELSEVEQLALEAKQTFQEDLLTNKGVPTAAMLLTYAEALKKAECYLEAADHYVQLESLNGSNHATNICFCLAMAGNQRESRKWAKVAYDRKRTEITCYNYALKFSADDNAMYEKLLREALSHNPHYAPALRLLGDLRIGAGFSDGAEYLEKAADALASSIRGRIASARDCEQLEQLAERLGRDDLFELAQGRKSLLMGSRRLFNEENLATGELLQVAN